MYCGGRVDHIDEHKEVCITFRHDQTSWLQPLDNTRGSTWHTVSCIESVPEAALDSDPPEDTCRVYFWLKRTEATSSCAEHVEPGGKSDTRKAF